MLRSEQFPRKPKIEPDARKALLNIPQQTETNQERKPKTKVSEWQASFIWAKQTQKEAADFHFVSISSQHPIQT